MLTNPVFIMKMILLKFFFNKPNSKIFYRTPKTETSGMIFCSYHHDKAFQKADLILFDSHMTRKNAHQFNGYLAKHVNVRWLYSASFKSSCCVSLAGFLTKKARNVYSLALHNL